MDENMRVSKEKQNEINRSLVRAAVELFSEKGFSGATMREISTRAGLGAATIYNYFPNKEKIFYAYFELKQDELRETLTEVSELEAFTLKEKLQTLLESLLDSYIEDREFVAATYKTLLDSPMKSFTDLEPVKDKFTDLVRSYFASAIDSEAIPKQPFEDFLINLFWDYTNLVVLYWLRDNSKGFANTSRLIDLSLDIYIDVLSSGIVTKVADIFMFLLKSHIYGNIDKIYEIISVIGKLHGSKGKMKFEQE